MKEQALEDVLDVEETNFRSLRPLPAGLPEIEVTPFDYASTEGISGSAVGEGCQAFVFAVDRVDSQGRAFRCAIKVLKPSLAVQPRELRAFEREVNLLARLGHVHVCQFMAVGTTPSGSPCVLLEWVDQTLANALQLSKVGSCPMVRAEVEKRWPRAERLRITREFAQAMRYLHSHAIKDCVVLHRDLKPDNIGLTESGAVKLLDFGLAVCLVRANKKKHPLCSLAYALSGETGSVRYMPPEVARREEYGPAADVYSWAVTTWELLALTGKPYSTLGLAEHKALVCNGTTRPKIPRKLHPEVAGLLQAAWHAEPHKRPDFDRICAILAGLTHLHDPNIKAVSTPCLCG